MKPLYQSSIVLIFVKSKSQRIKARQNNCNKMIYRKCTEKLFYDIKRVAEVEMPDNFLVVDDATHVSHGTRMFGDKEI